jgi:WD40 repeat protein
MRTYIIHSYYEACFSQDGTKMYIYYDKNSGELHYINTMFSLPENEITQISSVDETRQIELVVNKLLEEIECLCAENEIALAAEKAAELKNTAVILDYNRYRLTIKKVAKHCVSTYSRSESGKSFDVSATSICFSPDAKRAFSGEESEMLKLWDIKSGECICTFSKDSKKWVSAACFSPDGNTVLSADAGGLINLWDIHLGTCIRTLAGPEGTIKTACFSPDGRKVLAGGMAQSAYTLYLFDVNTGECIKKFDGYYYTSAACFSPDGKTVLMAGTQLAGNPAASQPIKLLDADTGECIRIFSEHKEIVNSVCFAPDGQGFVTTGNKRNAYLWDIRSNEYAHALIGHQDFMVNDACYSPDGRLVLTGSGDNTMRLWDVYTGKCVQVFDGGSNAVFAVFFSPDGLQILAGGKAGISVRDIEYDFTFPGWRDWDDGALPFLQTFLTLRPAYTEADFSGLITELQNRGYGWLRPDGIRAKLNEMQRC